MDCDELSQKLLLLLRSKDYIPQTAAQLAESLGLKKGDAPALRRTLARLLSDGCIARVKGDKFGASSDLAYFPPRTTAAAAGESGRAFLGASRLRLRTGKSTAR